MLSAPNPGATVATVRISPMSVARRAVIAAAVVAAFAGCSDDHKQDAVSPHTGVNSCPTKAARKVASFVGPVVGDGPVYAGAVGRDATVTYGPPPKHHASFAGRAWGGSKVLWVVAPSYQGSIRIRGHLVDGKESVRFGTSRVPNRVLRLSGAGARSPGQGRWRGFPSTVRLHAPGCYALQIDGRGFSQRIVVRAVREYTA